MKTLLHNALLLSLLVFTVNLFAGDIGPKYYINSKSGLNLRSKPSINSDTLVTIPYHQKVNLIEKTDISDNHGGLDGTWWKVRWYQNEGYVFSAFLKENLIKAEINYSYEIKLIRNIHIFESSKKGEIILDWIESPEEIQNNQIMTIFPLRKGLRNQFPIRITLSEKQVLDDTGDAFLHEGFNKTKSGKYIRYYLTHERIIDKNLLDARNPDSKIGYISPAILIYPPVEGIACLKKNLVTKKEIPNKETLDQLAYALDFDQDKMPDLLMFQFDEGSFARGYIKNGHDWKLIFSYDGKGEIPQTTYLCN